MEGFDIIYPDDSMCAIWAEITAGARVQGRRMSPQDAWIAATALSAGAALVTNNGAHLELVRGLQLLEPRSGEAAE